MKRLLFALLMCIAGHTALAQCNAAATFSMAPQNNNLLRMQLANTSTYTTGPTKYTNFYVYWGDASSNYIGTGNNYHNYSSPGKKIITMMLQTWDSTSSGNVLVCSDTLIDSFQVAYQPCATSFTTSVSGSVVTVTANNPAGTSGMTYSWNWGDGSPAGSGSPATHTYILTGTKTITLTATNGSCTYTCVNNVSISSNSCSTAHANFTANTSGGLNVSFSNSSSFVTSTTQSSSWTFGDGGTSTTTNPTHTYASSGNYTVCIVTKWYDSLTTNLKCTDSICKTVTVSSTNQITGWILQDSAGNPKVDSPIYDIWLIKYDGSTGMLTAQDSIRVYGAYYMYTPYTFNNEPSGTYRVKAKLLNGPTSGTSYVPTYHYSSLMWNTATTFTHSGGVTTGKHIMLQKGTATSGPGFISGNVSAGANKSTSGSNNGIEGMNIFLLDAASNAVTCAVTDVNGDYSFSNLAPASYVVYPECMNYATTSASVVITNGNAVQTGLHFTRSNSQMSITPVPAGVTNMNNNKNTYSIFPNPAKDRISIQWNAAASSTANITITDVTGKKVLSTSATTNGNTDINLSGLQKGLYFINISSDKMQSTEKILLQ